LLQGRTGYRGLMDMPTPQGRNRIALVVVIGFLIVLSVLLIIGITTL
jgi:hypothetical protein